ncbi:hypothetical protein E2C01_101237 [Portunus trituberculatus]|uniref:Uncharacterized protein n=1 Tax=Portunus trituberculatus TaxID=210409 RepID=A0A5B7KJY7_PORTR|nr:hypothetical protein [Portunus trituberculatus]
MTLRTPLKFCQDCSFPAVSIEAAWQGGKGAGVSSQECVSDQVREAREEEEEDGARAGLLHLAEDDRV